MRLTSNIACSAQIEYGSRHFQMSMRGRLKVHVDKLPCIFCVAFYGFS